MTQESAGRPGLLKIIFEEVRDGWRVSRQTKSLAEAREHLERGDPQPMQHFASSSVKGDAWCALGDFYASHRPEDPVLATEAYRNALQCADWFDLSLSGRAHDEYDRRRFLGIGATQDFRALVKEWKSWQKPGDEREIQLAWIFTYGPAELRNLREAYWWIAMAEARWGNCQDDVELPTHSVVELREFLAKSVSEEQRQRLHGMAKTSAYDEFVYSR